MYLRRPFGVGKTRWRRANYGGVVTVKANSEDNLSLATDGGAYIGFNPYTPTRSGILYQGKPAQIRITDLGLFVERSSTNVCLRLLHLIGRGLTLDEM